MLSSSPVSKASREDGLDLVFRALGNQTRRDLLSLLANEPAMVTELAKPFEMSLPAVGKHLRVLEKAGLVERTVNGRVHLCTLNALPLQYASNWLEHYEVFWGQTLDALDGYFRNDSD